MLVKKSSQCRCRSNRFYSYSNGRKAFRFFFCGIHWPSLPFLWRVSEVSGFETSRKNKVENFFKQNAKQGLFAKRMQRCRRLPLPVRRLPITSNDLLFTDYRGAAALSSGQCSLSKVCAPNISGLGPRRRLLPAGRSFE